MKVWGLTGGVAAGKSQTAAYLRDAGIPVLDADALSRELSAPGGLAHDAIVKRLGTADRAELRERVFKDPVARKELEQILHPLIQAESVRRIQLMGAELVMYEAALLVETGRYKQFDGLLVIDAPKDLRRERLMRRDGITPELADRILSAQATDGERLQAATSVISNDGTPEQLKAKLATWLKGLAR